jgi:uncharacterized protein (TIGR03663 family)
MSLSLRSWDGPDADPVRVAVVALLVVGVVARLAALGARPAHYDEGRVAYWTLQYLDTGAVHYRYIIHGPFVQHAVRPLFAVFGPSDVVTRLPIAIVGAALPAAALLFRAHLRDVETVALAAFLAVNPILLYYSRFFRSTLLVAAFAFVAFGTIVRFVDTRRPRYLYATALALAVAFAAKENAIVYVLCFLGAGGLLLDHALLRPRGYDSGLARLRTGWRAFRSWLAAPAGRLRYRGVTWAGRVGLAVGIFLVVSLFFYAPRNPGGVGLWSAVGNPVRFPALIDATVEDIAVGYGYWFGGASEPGCRKETVIAGYVCYQRRFLEAMGSYAAPLSAFALVGLVYERYVRREPRNVVLAAGYWGVVSVIGYPLGTDVWGAWIVVNALVPLAVTAAVGVGVVVDWGRTAAANRDLLGAGLVVVVFVGGAVASGGAIAADVYGQPAAPDNDLVQYAQPSAELRPAVGHLRDRVDDTDRTDVLVYGTAFVDGDEEATRLPACVRWFDTLPLAWYTAAADADVTCATGPAELPASGELPPVIVAPADARSTLGRFTDDYESVTFEFRRGDRPAVLYYRTGEDADADWRRPSAGGAAAAPPGADAAVPVVDAAGVGRWEGTGHEGGLGDRDGPPRGRSPPAR